jgi:hypothetical protein
MSKKNLALPHSLSWSESDIVKGLETKYTRVCNRARSPGDMVWGKQGNMGKRRRAVL